MKTPLLCVTADDDEADKLAGDLQLFLGGAPTVLRHLPADDALPWDELIPDSTVVTERLGALFHLTQGDDVKALVVSVRGSSRRVLPPSVMGAQRGRLNVATDHPMTALAKKLTDMGYRNSPLVEDVGSFPLRGDILDVFPPLEPNPVRLEFFGDYIEKMRQFDPETQRHRGRCEVAEAAARPRAVLQRRHACRRREGRARCRRAESTYRPHACASASIRFVKACRPPASRASCRASIQEVSPPSSTTCRCGRPSPSCWVDEPVAVRTAQ